MQIRIISLHALIARIARFPARVIIRAPGIGGLFLYKRSLTAAPRRRRAQSVSGWDVGEGGRLGGVSGAVSIVRLLAQVFPSLSPFLLSFRPGKINALAQRVVRRPLARSASAQPSKAGASSAVPVAHVVLQHLTFRPCLQPALDPPAHEICSAALFGRPRAAHGSPTTAAPHSLQACNAAFRRARRTGQKRQDRGAMLRARD